MSVILLTLDSPRIAVFIAVASFWTVAALPETLASKLLSKRAEKLNKAAGCNQFVAEAVLNRESFWVSLVCLRIPAG